MLQLSTAAGSQEEAGRLAEVLLAARLAACVQVVGPVHSRYWWEGRIESATEWLCVAKTTVDRVEAAIAAVRAAHSYEVPEIVATPVVAGNDAYLAWVVDEADGIGPVQSDDHPESAGTP